MHFLKKSFFIFGILLIFAGVGLGGLRLYHHRNPLPIVLQALPLPSTFLGPPKGHVYAKEACVKDYTSIYPSYEEIYPPFPFASSLESIKIQFPELFVVTLEKGRVYGCNGLVITAEDRVLADTAIDWISCIEDHKIFRKNRLPKVTYTDETVAVVASKSAGCFYHWMFDVLPRLEILKQSNLSYDKIYLNPLTEPFQRDTFAKLGLDEKKIIWASPDQHICAKKLIVPSLPGGITSLTSKLSCSFLKTQFLNNDSLSEGKKIYISRRGSRKIINERELVKALEKLGFEEVLLENLSILKQAELFSSAHHIVAPHGAGLSNLVFCKEGAHLIEIFSPHYLNPCYWYLSHAKHIKHVCLMGSEEGLNETQKKNNDIFVNIDDILAYVSKNLCE